MVRLRTRQPRRPAAGRRDLPLPPRVTGPPHRGTRASRPHQRLRRSATPARDEPRKETPHDRANGSPGSSHTAGAGDAQPHDPRPVYRRHDRTRQVPSYVDEPGVDPSRNTETYASLTLQVDNPRWAGVPFTLRSGKASPRTRPRSSSTSAPAAARPAYRLKSAARRHSVRHGRDDQARCYKPACRRPPPAMHPSVPVRRAGRGRFRRRR